MTRAQCFLSDKAASPCRAWPLPSGQLPQPPAREPCPRKGLLRGKSLLQINRGLCLPLCLPECPRQPQEMQGSAHPGVPPKGSACLKAPPSTSPQSRKFAPQASCFQDGRASTSRSRSDPTSGARAMETPQITQLSRNLPPPNFLVGHLQGIFQDRVLWALGAGLYPRFLWQLCEAMSCLLLLESKAMGI